MESISIKFFLSFLWQFDPKFSTKLLSLSEFSFWYHYIEIFKILNLLWSCEKEKKYIGISISIFFF
jgi:hypothetical protein